MAIGTPTNPYDSGAGIVSTSTTVVSPGSNITTGAMAFLFTGGGSNKTLSSVTDNTGGNTWTVDATVSDGTRTAGVASCQVLSQISTSNTITATWSNGTSSTMNLSVCRVTGLATSSPFDKTASHTGVNGVWDAGTTATLSQASEIVFGIFRGSAVTGSAGSGYSPCAGGLGGSQTFGVEYQIVASTAAVNPNTGSATASWVGLTATYKAPSSGGVVILPSLAATGAGT